MTPSVRPLGQPVSQSVGLCGVANAVVTAVIVALEFAVRDQNGHKAGVLVQI